MLAKALLWLNKIAESDWCDTMLVENSCVQVKLNKFSDVASKQANNGKNT